MNPSFLWNTTRPLLSDDVIASVAPRIRSVHQSKSFMIASASLHEAAFFRARGCNRSEASLMPPPVNNAAPIRKNHPTPLTTTDIIKAASASRQEDAPRTRKTPTPNTKEMERERRRESMARLRKKQRDLVTQLESSTRQLREDVDELQRRRYDMLTGIPAQKDLWSACTEYFRLFRYGVQHAPSIQARFVRDLVASDVVLGSRRGKDQLMQSWNWLASVFENFELRLVRLEACGDDALVVMTTTSFIITETTVREVFPHLFGRDSPLASTLVGQRVVMSGKTYLEWDRGHARLTSIISHCDLLTPILGLVGSLENASRVFEKSKISPDFLCREAYE